MQLYVSDLYGWVGRYVDILQDFIASKAVLAPLLLLFVEEAGIPLPVPGDMIIAYTGYRISLNAGGPGLWQAFVAAQLAALAGSTVLFFLSKRWGQWVILKLGKFIFLKEKHIQKAERYFARWGVLTIIVGRHVPGMRIPVTVFAATSGIKYLTFLASTFVSTSVWIIAYLLAGRRIGAIFQASTREYTRITVTVLAVIVAAIVVIHLVGLYREYRARPRTPQS